MLTKSSVRPIPINVVRATIEGLKQLRTVEEVARSAGQKARGTLGLGGFVRWDRSR